MRSDATGREATRRDATLRLFKDHQALFVVWPPEAAASEHEHEPITFCACAQPDQARPPQPSLAQPTRVGE